MANGPTLGTMLRHLVELLDGAVEEAYEGAGLDYRPRYTPVVRAIVAHGPSSILAIATHAGMTHSAVSQTVAQMAKAGLVALQRGGDGRERIVALTAAARAILPALERQWAATNAAAAGLDAELTYPLSAVLLEAAEALARRPFATRIAEARRGRSTSPSTRASARPSTRASAPPSKTPSRMPSTKSRNDK